MRLNNIICPWKRCSCTFKKECITLDSASFTLKSLLILQAWWFMLFSQARLYCFHKPDHFNIFKNKLILWLYRDLILNVNGLHFKLIILIFKSFRKSHFSLPPCFITKIIWTGSTRNMMLIVYWSAPFSWYSNYCLLSKRICEDSLFAFDLHSINSVILRNPHKLYHMQFFKIFWDTW